MAKTEEKYSFDGSNVYLRRLTEDDINEEYLSWFQDEVVQEFTDAGTRAMTREEVIAYVSRGQESEVRWTQSVGQNRGHIKSGSCCLKRIQ